MTKIGYETHGRWHIRVFPNNHKRLPPHLPRTVVIFHTITVNTNTNNHTYKLIDNLPPQPNFSFPRTFQNHTNTTKLYPKPNNNKLSPSS